MSIAIPATLVAARQAELQAVESGYGARIQYAQCLVDNSGGVLWFTDGVKMPELIEAEKAEYYKGLKAIGYSNASNAWRMVKKYALDYATQIGLVEKPEAEGGEETGPRHPERQHECDRGGRERDPADRLLARLGNDRQ